MDVKRLISEWKISNIHFHLDIWTLMVLRCIKTFKISSEHIFKLHFYTTWRPKSGHKTHKPKHEGWSCKVSVSGHCRNSDDAADLLRLRDEHPDTVVVKQLDITHYEKNFKEFIQDIKVSIFLPLKFYGVLITGRSNWISHHFLCCLRDLFQFLVSHLSNSIYNTLISGVKSS